MLSVMTNFALLGNLQHLSNIHELFSRLALHFPACYLVPIYSLVAIPVHYLDLPSVCCLLRIPWRNVVLPRQNARKSSSVLSVAIQLQRTPPACCAYGTIVSVALLYVAAPMSGIVGQVYRKVDALLGVVTQDCQATRTKQLHVYAPLLLSRFLPPINTFCSVPRVE